MDLSEELEAPCPPGDLFRWVSDLGRYPRWLGIVERAEPDRDEGDAPAWVVDLAARVGPFSRSKRLRMVRTHHEDPVAATFERRELDGRDHGSWILRAEIAPRAGGSHLVMRLHYGGRLWGPVLEPVLADEVRRSRERLLRLAVGEAAAP